MELKWYIDSWGPTEGVAFVSKREPCEDPWALEHTATLMIRAPDFEPRPVDRTFAFGAARRGFQERFAIEGLTEYGFDSLEYLTTFVSRIYLGSGPGTGAGESFRWKVAQALKVTMEICATEGRNYRKLQLPYHQKTKGARSVMC